VIRRVRPGVRSCICDLQWRRDIVRDRHPLEQDRSTRAFRRPGGRAAVHPAHPGVGAWPLPRVRRPLTPRSGSKYVVGTQQGVLSVFNRASGWADCVDRIPGHPHSVDALCALPAAYPSAHSTLLTGSSDGLLRAVQLYPTKLLGAIADHGAFPIERVRVDMGGQGTWVASVGHEEAIKMTDLREVFEDDKEGEGDEEGGDGSDDEDEDKELDAAAVRKAFGHEPVANEEETKSDSDSDSDSPDEPQAPPAPPPQDEDAADEVDSDAELPKEKKRKRKQADPLQAGRRKKGRDQMDAEKGFFSGL
jgi:hypothetical protein